MELQKDMVSVKGHSVVDISDYRNCRGDVDSMSTETADFNLKVPFSNAKLLPIFQIPFTLGGTPYGSHNI
jgi:hypothetical protein